jgi:hypothetical protein
LVADVRDNLKQQNERPLKRNGMPSGGLNCYPVVFQDFPSRAASLCAIQSAALAFREQVSQSKAILDMRSSIGQHQHTTDDPLVSTSGAHHIKAASENAPQSDNVLREKFPTNGIELGETSWKEAIVPSDERFGMWKIEVENLLKNDPSADGQAEPEDVAELEELLAQDRVRFEVAVTGDRPIFVTAPHSIPVLRDGDVPHKKEDYTAFLAHYFAKELFGTCLTWTATEQRCTDLLMLVAKAKGKMGKCGMLLDPRNRDPNYLFTAEVETNPWFMQMLSTAQHFRDTWGTEVATLHIDVHGCRDPPEIPSHLTIGLGAMMAKAEALGDEDCSDVRAFGASLEHFIQPVLARMNLQPAAKLMRVIIPENRHKRTDFAGLCHNPDRRTQSQQAISFADFTHSVQLEMSKVLRRTLSKTPQALNEFCDALQAPFASQVVA